MAAKLLTSAGGGITLEAASTATDKTITIPADNGTVALTSQLNSFRNRILNGAMVIDQRNAGASVTVNSNSNYYITDRFVCQGQTTDGVFTAQQVSDAPAGFTNSLKIQVTTADASIGSTQYYFLQQRIEGYNVADLGFGAAGASTVTLSFWAKSSVTGTFGGSLSNEAVDRSYPFTYTVSSANTWEYKTVTIAGDTTGTWLKTNGLGLRVYWNIGAGSSYTASAGAWAGQWAFNATGANNLIATSGATFQVTGVQLEKGSTATSFDYRPYGTELALCQRYCQRWGGTYSYESICTGYWTGTTISTVQVPCKVTMRTQPSLTTSGDWGLVKAAGGVQGVSTFSLDTNASGTQTAYINLTTASGGVTGQGTALLAFGNTSSSFVLSAEL